MMDPTFVIHAVKEISSHHKGLLWWYAACVWDELSLENNHRERIFFVISFNGLAKIDVIGVLAVFP